MLFCFSRSSYIPYSWPYFIYKGALQTSRVSDTFEILSAKNISPGKSRNTQKNLELNLKSSIIFWLLTSWDTFIATFILTHYTPRPGYFFHRLWLEFTTMEGIFGIFAVWKVWWCPFQINISHWWNCLHDSFVSNFAHLLRLSTQKFFLFSPKHKIRYKLKVQRKVYNTILKADQSNSEYVLNVLGCHCFSLLTCTMFALA